MRTGALFLLVACNVESMQVTPSGLADSGASCPRIAVVCSDAVSADIGAFSAAGDVLSRSIVSSGSATPGLSAALSGDVVLPHDRPEAGKLVVIDRYPNGVLTWIAASSAQIEGQLLVAPGFPSNPHDYLAVSEHKAYVTRYGVNPKPNAVTAGYDQGNDVLVIDPYVRTITGRIDLSPYNRGTALARPDRMTRRGDIAFVVLGKLSQDFQAGEEGSVVGIDLTRDAPVFEVTLGTSVRNCTSLALSPSRTQLAVGCAGIFRSSTMLSPREARNAQNRESALVLLDVTQTPPVVTKTLTWAAQLDAPLALTGLAYQDDRTVFATSFGSADLGLPDKVLRMDTKTGAVTEEFRARSAFVLGDIWCGPGCAIDAQTRCMLADGETRSVRSFAPASATNINVKLNAALMPLFLGELAP
jgi:hypothetical protein